MENFLLKIGFLASFVGVLLRLDPVRFSLVCFDFGFRKLVSIFSWLDFFFFCWSDEIAGLEI